MIIFQFVLEFFINISILFLKNFFNFHISFWAVVKYKKPFEVSKIDVSASRAI